MQSRWLVGAPPPEGTRGVFETLRWSGQPSAVLPLHVARWRRGCVALQLRTPDLPEILAQLPDAPDTLRVRVTAYPTGALELAWRPLTADEHDPQPWRLHVLGQVAPRPEALRACKTTDLWTALSCRADAQARGADDALLRGPDGSWAEATTANLLCGLHDGRLVTPWADATPLPGTTLAWLAESLPVLPLRVDAALLPDIRWAVLTNAVVLLRPVLAINGVALDTPPAEIVGLRDTAR